MDQSGQDDESADALSGPFAPLTAKLEDGLALAVDGHPGQVLQVPVGPVMMASARLGEATLRLTRSGLLSTLTRPAASKSRSGIVSSSISRWGCGMMVKCRPNALGDLAAG